MGKRVTVVPQKEGEENKSGSRWITPGTTFQIESCQGGSARTS